MNNSKEKIAINIFVQIARNEHGVILTERGQSIQELYEEAYIIDKSLFKQMDQQYVSKEMIKDFVLSEDSHLSYIDDKYIDSELVELVINKNSTLLGLIPEKFKTFEMCLKCLQDDLTVLSFIPTKFRIKEIAQYSISQCAYSVILLNEWPENIAIGTDGYTEFIKKWLLELDETSHTHRQAINSFREEFCNV